MEVKKEGKLEDVLAHVGNDGEDDSEDQGIIKKSRYY